MNTEFKTWLTNHRACFEALGWLETRRYQSLKYAWRYCPRGDWMLWLHHTSGTPFETLAPVVYLAVNRAMKYASVDTVTVVDKKTARQAAYAAYAADAADAAAYAAAYAADAYAADAAAADAAAAAAADAYAVDAADAAAAADADAAAAAEHRLCANDCRNLLPMPILKK